MHSKYRSFLAPVAIFTLASFCSLGCSRKNNPDFDGTFNGKSTSKVAVRLPDGSVDKDDKPSDPEDDTYKISDLDGPEIKITVFDDDDSVGKCDLQATRSGTSASIKPGQSCVMKNEGEKPTTWNVTKGTFSLAGDQLTMDLVMAATIKEEGVTANGSMAIHFVGKRGA